MMTFSVIKNSWHHKLAKFGGLSLWCDDETDICEYTRRCILGTVYILLWLVGGICLSIPIIDFIFAVVFSLYYMTDLFSETAIAGGTILFVPFGTYCMIKYGDYRNTKNRQNRKIYYEPKPDGFIKTAYNSYKEKFCVRIKFNESNNETL